MPVAPFAVRRLIPPGSNDPRIVATQVILHVAVSEAPSLFDFFAHRSGGIESHFYIRRDGTVEQYRDTDYEADANYTANQRAISVETQGMGDGEWTPQQLDAIKRLLMWAHDQHGIPLRPCPAHDQPGIGYHVLFGAPGPWTPVAKSCPGPDRVKQFNTDLVPWMHRSGTTSTQEDDDMPNPDDYLNEHEPRGRLETRGITWREAQVASVIHILKGRRAARKFLLEAKESKGEKS